MTNIIKSLYLDLKGIILTPGKTLGYLMEKKKWLAAFLLIFLLMSVFSYITLPAQMQQRAELIRNSELFDNFSDQQIASMSNCTGSKRLIGVFWSLFLLSLSLTIGAFFTYIFYGIGRAEGLYINYFTLVVNGSLIDIVIPLIIGSVSLILNLNLMNLVRLSTYLPSLAKTNFINLLASQIDLFSIWYIVAIAAGVSHFSKISFKKSLRIGFSYFILKSLVKIIFAYLSLKIIGM